LKQSQCEFHCFKTKLNTIATTTTYALSFVSFYAEGTYKRGIFMKNCVSITNSLQGMLKIFL